MFTTITMKQNITLLLVQVLIMNLLKEVSSMIACFDCVSRNGDNPACEDWYGPDNSSFGSYNITYKLLNRDCRFGPFALEGYYCYKIKATKVRSGETIVLRSCTMEKMGSQCGKLLFEYGDLGETKAYDEEYLHGCLETCDTDGCNGASRRLTGVSFLLFSLALNLIGLCLILY